MTLPSRADDRKAQRNMERLASQVAEVAAGGITYDAAETITGANDEGVSTAAARADHDHALATNVVGSDQIAAGAVGTSEIAADAVETSELANAAVEPANLHANTIDLFPELIGMSGIKMTRGSATVDISAGFPTAQAINHGLGTTPTVVLANADDLGVIVNTHTYGGTQFTASLEFAGSGLTPTITTEVGWVALS